MKTVFLFAAALLIAAPAARAADPFPSAGETERELREGLEKILRALEGFVKSIPVYEAPFIDENGDIIIKRKQRTPERPERGLPESDSTRT